MFHGNGYPIVYLVGSDGITLRTWMLPHPSSGGRAPQFVLDNDPMRNPLTGRLLPRKFGFIYKLKLTWRNASDSEVEDIIEIANSDPVLKLKVKPHNDTDFIFEAQVTGFELTPTLGKVNNNQVSITFESIYIKPVYNADTYYAGSRFRSGKSII